jgi:hypothetical protein
MMNFDRGKQGGPVFFWVMMSIIQSSTEDAIRGLEAKIQSLKNDEKRSQFQEEESVRRKRFVSW